jgi:hypothetical protein
MIDHVSSRMTVSLLEKDWGRAVMTMDTQIKCSRCHIELLRHYG